MKGSKLSEFYWDKVDIVGMVEFNGEDMVLSWWHMVRSFQGRVGWSFFWIAVVVVGLLIDVALKAGLDLLFTAPPSLGGSFLC